MDANNMVDDIIHVDCPETVDNRMRTFFVKRSVLARSPVLHEMMSAPEFLPGTELTVTFPGDSAVCFDIAGDYLEQGPDRFTSSYVKDRILSNFDGVKAFIVLARVHLFAVKLGLPILMDTLFHVLNDIDWQMTAPMCPTLASLIYFPHLPFHKTLKEWCLRHVKHHIPTLLNMDIWKQLLADSDYQPLALAWVGITNKYNAVHHAGGSDVVDVPQLYKEVLEDDSAGERELIVQHNSSASLRTLSNSDEQLCTEHNEDQNAQGEERSNEGENTNDTTSDTLIDPDIEEQSASPRFSLAKARDVLGVSPEENFESRSSIHSKLSDENHKARQVLGINSDGGGVISGRRKPTKLEETKKAIFKLMH